MSETKKDEEQIPEDDVTMSAEEVAQMLGLNRKTVYEAAGRGDIPCRRLGRRCLFFRPAILAWLEFGPKQAA